MYHVTYIILFTWWCVKHHNPNPSVDDKFKWCNPPFFLTRTHKCLSIFFPFITWSTPFANLNLSENCNKYLRIIRRYSPTWPTTRLILDKSRRTRHTHCKINIIHFSDSSIYRSTLCDNVCKWHGAGWWFSQGILVSSTNKTIASHQDIAEILLKVVLKHHKLSCSTAKIYLYCVKYFMSPTSTKIWQVEDKKITKLILSIKFKPFSKP